MRSFLFLFVLAGVLPAAVKISPGTDAATIQAAIDTDGHIVFEKGEHVLDAKLIIDSRTWIEGEPGAKIKCLANAFVEVSGYDVRISGLRIESADDDQVQGVAIALAGPLVHNLKIWDCFVYRFEFALDDAACDQVEMLFVRECGFYYSKTRLANAFGMLFFNRCAWSNVGTWPDSDQSHFAGVMVEVIGAEGCNFTDCHVQASGDITNPNWVVGFRFADCFAVELDRTMADGIEGFGIALIGCKYPRLRVKVSHCKNNGLWMENCAWCVLEPWLAIGRADLAEHLDQIPNVHIQNCNYERTPGSVSVEGTADDNVQPSVTVEQALGL